MERESFEDPEIGKLLSEHFVSIKVKGEKEGVNRWEEEKKYQEIGPVCKLAKKE